MMLILLGDKLYTAPIVDKPQVNKLTHHRYQQTLTLLQRVLDVGTGTGIWAMYDPFSNLNFRIPLRISNNDLTTET